MFDKLLLAVLAILRRVLRVAVVILVIILLGLWATSGRPRHPGPQIVLPTGR